MFRLAHITDPHLGPMPPVRPGDILNKRLFGYLSWIRKRRAVHRPEVLGALAADMALRAADHLVITGDLTNIALPEEFTRVAHWLEGLGTAADVTVIPGNHDAYVAVPWAQSLAKWTPYMSGDSGAGETGAGPGAAAPAADAAFPFVRHRGPAAIVGLSSAQPTPLFCAHGTLGERQLARLEALLRRLGEEGRFRVVLLHHPPDLEKVAWRKRLVDAEPFRRVIAAAGAELILHGHDHTFGDSRIAGPGGPVPVVGVPSASAASDHKKPLAHYQVYGIERQGNGWRVTVEVYGYDPASGSFAETRTYTL